jgi:hypothetical protein
VTFICETTGMVHFCGKMCERQVMNSERIMICELSGLSMTLEGESKPEPFISNKSINPLTFLFFNRLSESTATDGDIFLPSIQPRNVNIKLKGVNGYFAHTFNEVARCFSDNRTRADDLHNMRHNNKKTETLRKQMERDKKQSVTSNLTSLLSEAHKFDLINTTHTPMLLDDDAKLETITRLSWKCMKMWYIIQVHILPNIHTPPSVPTAFPVCTNLPLPPASQNFTPSDIQRDKSDDVDDLISVAPNLSLSTSYLSASASSLSPTGSGMSCPTTPTLSNGMLRTSISMPARPSSASAPPVIRVFPTTSKRRTPYIFGTNYNLFILGALMILAEGVSFIETTGQEIVLIEAEDILKVYPPWIDTSVTKNARRDPTRQRQAIYEAIKKCFSDATKLDTIDRSILMLTDIRHFPDESIFA